MALISHFICLGGNNLYTVVITELKVPKYLKHTIVKGVSQSPKCRQVLKQTYDEMSTALAVWSKHKTSIRETRDYYIVSECSVLDSSNNTIITTDMYTPEVILSRLQELIDSRFELSKVYKAFNYFGYTCKPVLNKLGEFELAFSKNYIHYVINIDKDSHIVKSVYAFDLDYKHCLCGKRLMYTLYKSISNICNTEDLHEGITLNTLYSTNIHKSKLASFYDMQLSLDELSKHTSHLKYIPSYENNCFYVEVTEFFVCKEIISTKDDSIISSDIIQFTSLPDII